MDVWIKRFINVIGITNTLINTMGSHKIGVLVNPTEDTLKVSVDLTIIDLVA